ncbi:hypothetical protein EDB92DRAFT_40986 [Lactarius akahatsu]|uniref:Uncharacterized protein n=1 Tax=Lactarius akahatsu TaxID=416441 RepID=A0AAD4LRI5_9AGAM|nr:hypothetical protein EDB92DRAFT_40986 [Lactarius akahatsu]
MLIYVAVLTQVCYPCSSHPSCRITRFLFFLIAPVITFFFFNICRYRQRFHNSVLYALYYLTCFRTIITFSIRGNFFCMLLLTRRLYCWNHCFAR